MISPELEIYEFLDDKGFPYEDLYEPQRIPKHKDPNFISPRPGCFGQGIVSKFICFGFISQIQLFVYKFYRSWKISKSVRPIINKHRKFGNIFKSL